MSAAIDVEVVFALPDKQHLVQVRLAEGATVADAIAASAIEAAFPDYDLAQCAVGVWGRLVERDRVLVSGDRVELYRALQMDPREARRRLAAAGKTMRQSARD
jgi:putative ubiquitin-RnfH superfamily antitoxin RatB of RatAB toxin-antitoxin module